VLGTQAVATLIAVYGVLMAPLGWKWAALTWAYALAWFLVEDRVKLLGYRIFDPEKSSVLGSGAMHRQSLFGWARFGQSGK